MHALNKKRLNKKSIILIGSAVALIAIVTFWYIVIYNGSILSWSLHSKDSSQSNHGTDYNPPTSDQVKNGSNIKSNSLNDKTKTGASGSDLPPAPAPSTNGKSVVQMNITAINQTNSSLQIRTLISALSEGGTCTITATKTGATTITQTANVQNLSNTSTCQGFDLPISQMSKGTWNITIDYSSTTLTGSASSTATIQ